MEENNNTQLLPLMNVAIVNLLRQIINPAKIESLANRLGFRFDVAEYLEYLMTQSPVQFTGILGEYTNAVLYWISNNFIEFTNASAETVTEKINRFLLYQPKVISFFGYSFALYTTPKQMRQYAIYGAIGLAVIFGLTKMKKKRNG